MAWFGEAVEAVRKAYANASIRQAAMRVIETSSGGTFGNSSFRKGGTTTTAARPTIPTAQKTTTIRGGGEAEAAAAEAAAEAVVPYKMNAQKEGERATEWMRSMVQLYEEITGSGEVRRFKARVDAAYEQLQMARSEFTAATDASEGAAARYEARKAEISSQIRQFEADSMRTREEKNEHYFRTQQQLAESSERTESIAQQQRLQEAKLQLDTLTDGYVGALRDQHNAATVWAEARSVVVAAGSIISVLGALVLTPLATTTLAGHRVENAVSRALESEQGRIEDTVSKVLSAELGATQDALTEAIEGRGPVTVSPSEELLQLNKSLTSLTDNLREGLRRVAGSNVVGGDIDGGGGSSSGGRQQAAEAAAAARRAELDNRRTQMLASRLEAVAVATMSLQQAVINMEQSVKQAHEKYESSSSFMPLSFLSSSSSSSSSSGGGGSGDGGAAAAAATETLTAISLGCALGFLAGIWGLGLV